MAIGWEQWSRIVGSRFPPRLMQVDPFSSDMLSASAETWGSIVGVDTAEVDRMSDMLHLDFFEAQIAILGTSRLSANWFDQSGFGSLAEALQISISKSRCIPQRGCPLPDSLDTAILEDIFIFSGDLQKIRLAGVENVIDLSNRLESVARDIVTSPEFRLYSGGMRRRTGVDFSPVSFRFQAQVWRMKCDLIGGEFYNQI